MLKALRAAWRDGSAFAVLEYALIFVLVAVVLMLIVDAFGRGVLAS